MLELSLLGACWVPSEGDGGGEGTAVGRGRNLYAAGADILLPPPPHCCIRDEISNPAVDVVVSRSESRDCEIQLLPIVELPSEDVSEVSRTRSAAPRQPLQ